MFLPINQSLPWFSGLALLLFWPTATALPNTALITDDTNYNVGTSVSVRLQSPQEGGSVAIRYAGDPTPIERGVRVSGDAYQVVWNIPPTAKTGRYLLDLTTPSGTIAEAGSFAVHRQLAKVVDFQLDKTFYTSGDPVNPRITVQNISAQTLQNLQVEFEAYTYPWIAPAADEPPAWKTIAASSLSLAPGEKKEFQLNRAAVVRAEKDETYVYFSAVIRDAVQNDRIYDLAFALPAITAPLSSDAAKSYPFLYLYRHLREVPRSESYRQFYPAEYVSSAIHFDTSHTMFVHSAKEPPSFSFRVDPVFPADRSSLAYRVLDKTGGVVSSAKVAGTVSGEHRVSLKPEKELVPGAYTLEVSVLSHDGLSLASNRLDFAVNDMPKSILLFCAHEDDDTAHPEIIRSAVENRIPIHVVYFTSGDAGGCDRYFMHSCDAARAMEFGEVRMNEARASLAHLGIPASDIHFLGLPDGGMEQIWKYNLKSAQPYLSVLLASEHAPYFDVAVPNLPYSREAVLQATRDFIQRYQPDMIITGHPDERHVDHRTNNWFVAKAMQGLLSEGKLSAKTQLVVDAVYGPGPQKHAPYRYEKFPFFISGQTATLGQEALWYYQSQDGNHQQAEIIPYADMPREAPKPHYGIYTPPYPHFRILDWQEHAGWNE
jgi:LmbE family N-acetylglucosaminyl deacetylase